MGVVVYGIPNCDSVKKARTLLTEQGIAYEFHDYKKHGVPETLLRPWVKARGWETLLNRKGSTWRALEDAEKAAVVDAASAVKVMLANPSIIKRPVVTMDNLLVVGLDDIALITGPAK